MTPEQARAEEAARRARAEIAASSRAGLDRRAAEAARRTTGAFSPMAPGGFTLPPLAPRTTGPGRPATPSATPAPGPSGLGTPPRGRAADAARYRGLADSLAGAGGDWTGLIEALGRQTNGGYAPVGVDRSMFQLAQTPEEQAMLQRELDDIEARRSAGSIALRAGWSQVADTNRRAAEKARTEVVRYGDAAAAAWTDAARRAQELAAARANAAGAFEGRQSINVSPTGGAEDFIMFMESQAPAARQYAESMQNVLAEDLDWAARTASGQGEAYAADLQRQANQFAFERAREHNRAVQERIAAERMALAQMEFQAASTNAQLAQASRQSRQPYQTTLIDALLSGDAAGPSVFVARMGMSPSQAQAFYNSVKASPLGQSFLAQAASAGK